MGRALVLMLVFVSAVFIAAGCGGGDSGSREYVNPYEGEVSGRSGTVSPPPASPGTGPGTSSKKAVGDATGGGQYGKRIIKGSGQEGLGGAMDEASYREWASIGKAHSDAVKLYRQYFSGKEASGKLDTATLDRAIAMYEQLLVKADGLLSKYEGNKEVESQYQEIINDLRALKDEKN